MFNNSAKSSRIQVPVFNKQVHIIEKYIYIVSRIILTVTQHDLQPNPERGGGAEQEHPPKPS